LLPPLTTSATPPITTAAPKTQINVDPLENISAFLTPAAAPGANGPEAAYATGETAIAAPTSKEIIARFTLSSS
jgi:hypothetical protein